jgi:hypothetical protein
MEAFSTHYVRTFEPFLPPPNSALKAKRQKPSAGEVTACKWREEEEASYRWCDSLVSHRPFDLLI